jgi:transcriptional regulator with XRE-family HTH domain
MDIQKSVSELLGTGLTQDELAGLVPCGQSTINAYFKGKRGKRPSLEIGQRIIELHRQRCQHAPELS